MKKRITVEELVALVDGDQELVFALIEQQIVVAEDSGYSAEDVDRVLASRTLLRELEVNYAGVDIILRLRHELASALRRIAELEAKKKP